eukprot:gene4945-34719_t
MYELHIYTMGDRSYANEIWRILDADKKIFSSAISQNDSTSSRQKDLDVALVNDKMVVILDDTEHVWPNHQLNLIPIERYHFFPASLRQWNATAKSMLDLGHDESPTDGMLATCLRVLKEVHARFYGTEAASTSNTDKLNQEQKDVRYCLSSVKESVLKGCVLAFSHCWSQAVTDPWTHPLWKLAESLGAECTNTYDPQPLLVPSGHRLVDPSRVEAGRVTSHCWSKAVTDPWTHPVWKLAESLGAECTNTYGPQHVTHLIAATNPTNRASVTPKQQGPNPLLTQALGCKAFAKFQCAPSKMVSYTSVGDTLPIGSKRVGVGSEMPEADFPATKMLSVCSVSGKAREKSAKASTKALTKEEELERVMKAAGGGGK